MGKVIGLISIKGGVGKTTISAALASSLANAHNQKVLLIDANYSAPNLGIHMDIISPKKTIHDVLAGDKISEAIHEKYNIDVIPGNFMFNKNTNPLKLKTKLTRIKQKYDFIILDSSPSMNEEVLSTILASDSLFVVTTPDYPTLSCSMKAAKLAKQRGKPISGIIINRITGKHEISLEEIQASTGIPVVGKIKEDSTVRMALHERVPAPLFAKRAKFSREMARISGSIAGKKMVRSILDKALFLDFKTEEVNREFMRKSFYTTMFN